MEVILVGAGGHARSCIDVIELCPHLTIAGLTGVDKEVGGSILGYPICSTDANLELPSDAFVFLITVGQIKSASLRIKLYSMYKSKGCEAATVISPRSYVSDHASIGEGTIVMNGAIVNAGAIIGRNCIINSQALIEHNTIIADHCHISTGALINGGVSVGNETFIGSGSIIKEGIVIGERCFIGMGQRVSVNCSNDTKVTLPML